VRTASSLGTPGELEEAEFDARLDGLDRVDVVCTQMPPRLPGYAYDVVARKFEPGSAGLLGYVRRCAPRFALFGHVHNPLVSEGMIEATQMRNVGHFQAHGRGFTFDVPDR
jgi:Icc-related predicted phosphoesterase